MTSRQVYEATLIECNQTSATSLLLEDYNYLINKAIYQYIDKRYNLYDINQQLSDDLRVLKSTCILTPTLSDDYPTNSIFGATYEVNLPDDYFHVLNCICEYNITKQFKCYDANSKWAQSAKRLTSDMWSQVINNAYNKPSYRNPYFFIHNVNSQSGLPTNSYTPQRGTDVNLSTSNFRGTITCTTATNLTINGKTVTNFTGTGSYEGATSVDISNNTISGGTMILVGSFTVVTADQSSIGEFSGTATASGANTVYSNNSVIKINVTSAVLVNNIYNKEAITLTIPQNSITLGNGSTLNTVERTGGHRFGNVTRVRLEIRYGKDNSLFQLDKVYVDYLKTPQHIRLTPLQLDTTEDTSQVLEFPDYVCQEIIKELVILVMENSSNPRLQTNIPINQAIPSQTQQTQQTQNN